MTKTKRLQKDLLALEEQIAPEYRTQYSDMIVYLRSSQVNEYHQELIRQDIAQLLVDGQSRGESLQAIFGPDSRSFMDDVIASAPMKTQTERLLGNVGLGLMIVTIMGVIYGIRDIILYFTLKQSPPTVNITAADLVLMVIIGLLSVFLVSWISRNAFDQLEASAKSSLIKPIAIGLCIGVVFVGLMFLSAYFPEQFTLRIPFITYAIALAILGLIRIGLSRFLEDRYHKDF